MSTNDPEYGSPDWDLMQERFRAEVERREPTFRFVSVRQEAAEKAYAAGRRPCGERSHPADCPGGCCPHANSVTTSDGNGAYCADCGETLA